MRLSLPEQHTHTQPPTDGRFAAATNATRAPLTILVSGEPDPTCPPRFKNLLYCASHLAEATGAACPHDLCFLSGGANRWRDEACRQD